LSGQVYCLQRQTEEILPENLVTTANLKLQSNPKRGNGFTHHLGLQTFLWKPANTRTILCQKSESLFRKYFTQYNKRKSEMN